MDVNQFLQKFLTPEEIYKLSHPRAGVGYSNKVLIFDCPIKKFNEFAAKTLMLIKYNKLSNFSMIVGNEGASIIGSLLAVGYTPDEILELLASNELNVTKLIEDGQKLPNKLHKRKNGAMHKGLRLRDKLDELYRRKIPGDSKTPVLMCNLAFKYLSITATNLSNKTVVDINNNTYPLIPLADAVLASCAVFPYIRKVEYVETVDDKKEITFFSSCSNKVTLPIERAQIMYMKSKFHKKKGVFEFSSVAVGFYWGKGGNEEITQYLKGNDQFKDAFFDRADPIIPPKMKSVFHKIVK